tara:strand:+ start:406 stop:1125 length:720 start_codon:yes stop_codon:yes gene_type:complete
MKNPPRLVWIVKSVTIIIPVKDEEVGLQYLLDNYKNSEYFNVDGISFIFVIDGRTSDLSKNVARNFSDVIIDQYDTHGKGSAVRQALDIWRDNKTDFVVFMDADGSYSFGDVSKIIGALNDDIDVVSGSRFISQTGIPVGMGRLHNFGNRILSKISSIRNRRKISDLCTGLWGFKSESIDKLNLQSKGFDLEAEIAGKSRKASLSHKEVPVKWSARKGGTSKLKSFRDGSIILFRIIMT